jgi:hypothetical protein
MAPAMHDARAPIPRGPHHPIATQSETQPPTTKHKDDDRLSLFRDIPEAKKPKFIVVDEPAKKQRVRVRTTLDAVNTDEIPDSFRKTSAVYPRSWFPMQMQDPPPSAHGIGFFDDDDDDVEVNPRARRGGRTLVPVPGVGELAVPRRRRSTREREIRINELGYRMAWHQSRVFDGKPVFLQKARKSRPLYITTHVRTSFLMFVSIAVDMYRAKMCEKLGQEVSQAPHFETRVAKKRWSERMKQDRNDGRA